MNINITDNARDKIADILAENNNPNTKLRVYVHGGGCAGMNYGFSLENDISEDDFEMNIDGVSIVIDSVSAQYLNDATVDYVEELMNNRFVVDNPNAEVTCGCGTSFKPILPPAATAF